MILSTAPQTAAALPAISWWPALVAAALYAVASVRASRFERYATVALLAAWVVHVVALAADVLGWGRTEAAAGLRLGFAPVLSLTTWIVIGLHTIESRLVPLPKVRGWLAPVGAAVVLLSAFYPGDVQSPQSSSGALHFVLGLGAYGLFGAAVLHAALLDAAERRLRTMHTLSAPSPAGMPLLQLERLTFRFVGLGFAVLTAAVVLGFVTAERFRWDHKTVFSVLGWFVFAALLAGRAARGWRGRRATRWLYVGSALLLLGYVGSRFVFEVLLARPPHG